MSPFSLLLNIFVLNAPCSWVCYLFEKKKVFFWIMVISTLGLLSCVSIAVLDGSWEVLYMENIILGMISLMIGGWYCLKKRKGSKDWISSDD